MTQDASLARLPPRLCFCHLTALVGVLVFFFLNLGSKMRFEAQVEHVTRLCPWSKRKGKFQFDRFNKLPVPFGVAAGSHTFLF